MAGGVVFGTAVIGQTIVIATAKQDDSLRAIDGLT
jgi:hypothetical protein